MRKSLLLLLLLLASSLASAQFQRLLPQAGELGRTGEVLPLPAVKINNLILRLVPGAVIWDQNNRTLLHSQLPVGADVFVVRDTAGDIVRMYILTDEEKIRFAVKPPPRPVPAAAGAPMVQPGSR